MSRRSARIHYGLRVHVRVTVGWGATRRPARSFSGAFFHNVVRGRVLDPQGEPVAGAALRIGSDLVVTDSDGNFLVRVKRAGDLHLDVAFDEFTVPGSYVVVDAPAVVKATIEESRRGNIGLCYVVLPNVQRRLRIHTIDPHRGPNAQSPADYRQRDLIGCSRFSLQRQAVRSRRIGNGSPDSAVA